MSGYQPFETLRSIIVSGPPAMPVVDRSLVRPVFPKEANPRRGVRPNDRTIATIREMRAEGCSLKEISETVGFSESTAIRWTRDIPPPAGGWKTGARQSKYQARIEFARRLRRSGFSYREIAKELGCVVSWAKLLLDKSRRSPRKVAPVTSSVVDVYRVTGVLCSDLRQSLGSPRRNPAEIEKARSILYWMLNTRHDLSYSKIGRSLGFDHSTIRNGCIRTKAVIAKCGYPDGDTDRRVMDAARGFDGRVSAERLRAAMREHEDVLGQFPDALERLNRVAQAQDGLDGLKGTLLGRLAERNPTTANAINVMFPRGLEALANGEREIGAAMASLTRENRVFDGRLFVYQANTDTPLPAYSDADFGTRLQNPVPMRGNGTWPLIYLPPASYRLRATDPDGYVYDQVEDYTIEAASGGGGGGGGDVDPNALIQTGDVLNAHRTGTRPGFVRRNGRTIGSPRPIRRRSSAGPDSRLLPVGSR